MIDARPARNHSPHSQEYAREAFQRLQPAFPHYEDKILYMLRRRGITGASSLLVEPHTHGERSQTVYVADGYRGGHRILAGMLEGGDDEAIGKVTSVHSHEYPVRERYIKLGGEPYVNTLEMNGNLVVARRRIAVPNGEGIVVPPGVPHFAYTERDPSFTLIIMENAQILPEDEQHVPLQARMDFGEEPTPLNARRILTSKIPVIHES